MIGPDWLGRRTLLAVALGLLALAVPAGHMNVPAVAVALVFLAGLATSFVLARSASEDQRLAWIVCGTYVLRAGLGVGFFLVSAAHLPLFPSLQLGDGFWGIAPDAAVYHARALELYRSGGPSAWAALESRSESFAAPVAGLYWLLGPHPLIGILFNVWAATATVVLAFAVARKIGGSTTRGLVAALAVGLWPSFLIWTTQLLREALFFLLLFLVFVMIARVLTSRPGAGWRLAPTLAVVTLAVLFLTRSRFYAGWVLLGAAVMAALVALTTTRRTAMLALSCCAAVALGTWTGVKDPRTFSGARRLLAIEQPLSLAKIDSVRHGFAISGGNMTEMAAAPIATPIALLQRLPSAVAAGVFAPFPWRWGARGETGAFRSFAAFEVTLLALLLPGVLLGGFRVVQARSVIGWLMVASGVISVVLLGVVITNEGTLFRLRLQGIFPLLVVAAAGGGYDVYSRLLTRVARRRRAEAIYAEAR